MPADHPPAPGPDPTALFRYEVIAPLLHMDRGRGQLRRALEKLAARTWDDPRRGRVRIAKSTIEDWLYAYEKDGLQALELRARKDRGRSRKIQGPLADRVEVLARREPPLTGVGILAELEADDAFAEGELPALSTVYRFLRAKGIDLRRPPQARDSRAYGFDLAGDCWQADVMYGPHLPTARGGRRRTYLFAVIDDATRVIAHAQFYFEQHSSSLKDTLKQAFLKRGLPRRLYTDQGKIFRTRALAQLAARLAIQLIRGRPYQPQGKAKVERFFGTVRRSFLTRVDVDALDGIDALNRLLFAFVEGEYHVRPHRGLDGETPLDRWIRVAGGLRPLPPGLDLDRMLLEEEVRRVQKDGTLRLKGKRFEAGPHFIGHKLPVRFDPFDLRSVLVVLERGEERRIYPVDVSANRRVARRTPSTPEATKPTLRSLERRAQELEGGQSRD
jgi:transposase InsO family protein